MTLRVEGKLTNGKFEGITHISNQHSLFTMLATDQRGSLKRMLNPEDPSSVTPEQLKEVKLALIKNLAGRYSGSKASGVLVDPEYSYEREFLEKCMIRADVGLLMSAEKSGYGGQGEFAPQVSFFNGLDAENAVASIKKRGASAVKLLIYYRPDSPTAKHQEKMVKAIGEATVKYDIAFLLEVVVHSLEGGPHKKKNPKEFAKIKPQLVIDSAKELTKPEYGVDILKAEFPVDLRYSEELGQSPSEWCKALTEASQTPWVVLSAGVDFPLFKEQVLYASRNGASGFLAGRAIWKESVAMKNREEFLQTTGVERLNTIADIVNTYATPWYKKYVDSLEEIEIIRGE